MVLLLQHLKIL